MATIFFNKETATSIAKQGDAIVDNEELSTLEKAIAISDLVKDVKDMSHILVGGCAVSLFAAHVLSANCFTVAERKEFISFTPTTQEELVVFRSKNTVAFTLYSYLEEHLEEEKQIVELTPLAFELLPLVYESEVLYNILLAANSSVKEALAAVMEYTKI